MEIDERIVRVKELIQKREEIDTKLAGLLGIAVNKKVLRCSKCGERLLNILGNMTLNFYTASGERVPSWQLAVVGLLAARRADSAECPKCGYRFKTKAAGKAVASADPAIVDIEETERQEEGFGSDSRLVDNSKSTATVRRRFAVSKEWSRTYTVEYEKATVAGGGFDIGLTQNVGLKLNCEQTIRRHFSISEDSKETYSEEVEIEVPAMTKLRIVFQWKKIVQCGFIQVQKPNNGISRFPFRVAVGVTFDQTQAAEAA